MYRNFDSIEDVQIVTDPNTTCNGFDFKITDANKHATLTYNSLITFWSRMKKHLVGYTCILGAIVRV